MEKSQKSRGRPRTFEVQQTLQKAANVFWRQGYAGSSLDDLGAAMGLTRPSIYNAFGNKESLYRQALAAFCGQLDAGLALCLNAEGSVEERFVRFFEQALDVYCATEEQLGCLMICTAPAECIQDPAVREDLKGLIDRVDRVIETHLKQVANQGQLSYPIDAKQHAKLFQSVLHTLALRSRAGESKRVLRRFVRYAVKTLC